MSEANKLPIPDHVDEAIDHLEDNLRKDIGEFEAQTPDRSAAVGEQIAHALRAKRIEADGEFIEELREKRNFVKTLPQDPPKN